MWEEGEHTLAVSHADVCAASAPSLFPQCGWSGWAGLSIVIFYTWQFGVVLVPSLEASFSHGTPLPAFRLPQGGGDTLLTTLSLHTHTLGLHTHLSLFTSLRLTAYTLIFSATLHTRLLHWVSLSHTWRVPHLFAHTDMPHTSLSLIYGPLSVGRPALFQCSLYLFRHTHLTLCQTLTCTHCRRCLWTTHTHRISHTHTGAGGFYGGGCPR